MDSQRPIILLSFANQKDDYLQQLKKESDNLNDILSAHHDKHAIEVYREESTTVDNLTKAINRFSTRTAIFHYAGHAEGDRLHFEGGAGDASGLAALLGQLPNLQLVFLNGCSTAGQVDALLAQGVKAVIATAVPIDDGKAVDFADAFYHGLAGGKDIQSAFKFAVASLKLKYGGEFEAEIVQQGAQPQHRALHSMPWGLYVGADTSVLDWELPKQYETKVTRPAEVEYEVNRFLVDVLDEMVVYNKRLEERLYNEDGLYVDDREALSLIIENLPWPIGVQIRLLVTNDDNMNEPSVTRIQQLVSTYTVLTQFLHYVAMSQLWDEKRAHDFEVKSYLLDLLYMEVDNFNYFDYLKHFVQALRLMREAKLQPFVAEFNTFLEEFEARGELHDAYLFMEALKSKVNAGNDALLEADKFQLCADGEYFLSTLLIKIAFLVRYDLVTIRDIHVVNFRHTPTEFNHFMGRLNAKVTDVAIGRQPRPRSYNRFVNNASVVLTPNLTDLDTFLNLTPFIIDKNAFGEGRTAEKATEQQLFMYAFRQGEDFRYLTTIHNIYTAQERPTDQLSTGEGGESEAEERGRGRRRRRRRREEDEVQKPYTILQKQFNLFERDLTRS